MPVSARACGKEVHPMMQTRLLVISSVVIVKLVACSAPDEELTESAAQPVETPSDGVSGGGTCSHPICVTGGPLQSTCEPCVQKLCAQDPYCCNVAWDATCVGEVASICGTSCTAPPPPPADGGASTCSHPICATGGPLTKGCDPCVTKVCAADAYCCAVGWDATCVGEVASICKQDCT
jgi:hypothetical protein